MHGYFLHPILNLKSLVEDQSSDSVITSTINLLFTLWGFNNKIDNNSYIDNVLNRELYSLEEHH